MYKKSQIWTLDMIAGVIIFLIMITVFLIFTRNIEAPDNTDFDQLYNDAIIISGTMLSDGLSEDWAGGIIEEAGVTDKTYRLNITKLNAVKDLSYSTLKLLLKTQYDYLIFFEQSDGSILDIGGEVWIGKPGITKLNLEDVENPSNLVTVKRLVIHNGKILTMEVYSWS